MDFLNGMDDSENLTAEVRALALRAYRTLKAEAAFSCDRELWSLNFAIANVVGRARPAPDSPIGCSLKRLQRQVGAALMSRAAS